ncbi:ABC transporter substrate-binding protein [Embleya sp. NPDC001921]
MAARRRALALLVSASLAATAACSAGSGPGAKPSSGASLSSTTPPGNGALDRVTWALPMGEPTTLDPAKVGDYSPQTVIANLCDTLLRMAPDFSIGPGLAERATWADDHNLVLDLRPGVTFWDGAPLTPQDVVYSLRRQTDPKTQGIYGSALAQVTAIEATGPHQVTVRTKAHDEGLYKALVTPFGAVVRESFATRAGADYGTPNGGVMCTGPFKLSSWKSGDSITIARNDAYWDSALRPKVAQVVFRFVTNGNTLTGALLSGEIDGVYELPAGSAAALAKANNGSIHLGPATQNVLLVPGNPRTPAADRRLLDALSLAVDRNALIKNTFGGDATVLKSLTPPLTWAGDPAAAQLNAAYHALPSIAGPDLDRARRLVAEVGAPKRPLVTAIPAGDQRDLQIVTFLQAAAKKIGVDIEIRQLQPTEMSSLFYDPSMRDGLDLIVTFGYVAAPDAASYAADMVDEGALFNWTGYRNPEASRLLGQARTAADPAAAATAFTRAQAAYTPTLPVVYLVAPHERMFMNKRVSGAPSSFAYMNIPWAAHLGGTAS